MEDKLETPNDPRALATIVAGIRAELVEAAIASLDSPTRGMLIAELVVNDFFDHLLSALNVETFKGMEAWLKNAPHGYLWTSHGRLALLGAIAAFKQMFWLRASGYEYIASALDAIESAIVQVFPADQSVLDPQASSDLDVTIDGLLLQLALESNATVEHARAVSAWSARIAAVLNLEHEEAGFIRRAALLCDIGKLTTPREILDAQRSLEQNERRIMEQHAAAGARIVHERDELRPFVPVILMHHERFDGKGYPNGIAARHIPLAARIVSVADSFSAMTARRPHRQPLLPLVALDELHRHRATQFDPDVVDAMSGALLASASVTPQSNYAP